MQETLSRTFAESRSIEEVIGDLMYESYFDHFSLVDADSPFCIVRLIHPAYNDIEVVIAKTFGIVNRDDGQQELQFDYEVTQIPEGTDPELVKQEEFIALVRNIFMAILEKDLNEKMVYAESQPPSNQG